jgi:hypothetical protein
MTEHTDQRYEGTGYGEVYKQDGFLSYTRCSQLSFLTLVY